MSAASPGSGWIGEFSQKALSWFSQHEVKTPLAFYFRVVYAIVVIVLAGLYFAPAEKRFTIFLIGLLALGVPTIIVGLFAVYGVKNLLYGEAAHRAEWKLKLGTEKREITPAELATLPGITNPHALPESAQIPPPRLPDGSAQ